MCASRRLESEGDVTGRTKDVLGLEYRSEERLMVQDGFDAYENCLLK